MKYLFCLLFLLVSCSKSERLNDTNNTVLEECDELSGSLSLYPLADNPKFTTVDNTELGDELRVGMIKFKDEIRVYPYEFTFKHEVINDVYKESKFVFTYCPLTKSSLAFTSDNNFRASGYLINNNLVPWDEESESLWSQMQGKSIKGERVSEVLNTIPVVETKWRTVKKYFPSAKILTNDFIKSNKNEIIVKEVLKTPEIGVRVFSIVDNFSKNSSSPSAAVIEYSMFKDKRRVDFSFATRSYIVIGNEKENIINAFIVSNPSDYKLLDQVEFPFVLEDLNGVKYDIFGFSNNNEKKLVQPLLSYTVLWGALDSFFSDFTFVK